MTPSRSALRRMIERNRADSSRSSGPSSSSVSAYPWIEVIGVLSSWLTLAAKSDRIRSSLRMSVTSSTMSTTPRGSLFGENMSCPSTERRRPGSTFDSNSVLLSSLPSNTPLTSPWIPGSLSTSSSNRSLASSSRPNSSCADLLQVIRRCSVSIASTAFAIDSRIAFCSVRSLRRVSN